MDAFEAIRTFVRVVDTGSFSAVARETGIGQPAVSKQIAALEELVGAQLLQRTTRRVSVTEAGRELYESAQRLVDDLEDVMSRVGRRQTSPSGLLRVTVAPGFGRVHVLPRLGDLFRRFPDLTVDLVVLDRPVDLVREGIDVALHNGPFPDSTVVARKIAMTPIVTVATPRYLATHGEPRSLADLEGHEHIVFAPEGAVSPWRFKGKSGEVVVQPSGRLHTNDAEQIRAAVLADLGIAHTPGWLFSEDIAAGRVRRLLRAHERPPLVISAIHAGGRRVATKVRVFIEFLAEAFAKEPTLTPERPASKRSSVPAVLRPRT